MATFLAGNEERRGQSNIALIHVDCWVLEKKLNHFNMAKATGTMKRSVVFLWANPVDINAWFISEEILNKIKKARGTGIPELLLSG